MGKGKSSKGGTREPSDSLTVSLRSQPSFTARPGRHRSLSLYQDLRRFSFEPDFTRPARLFSGSIASTNVEYQNQNHKSRGRQAKTFNPKAVIAFSAPGETLVCVRRARRKEVLFAKKKTGKRGQRKARWSIWSKTKC